MKNAYIVGASELGQYVFCPEASRLKIQGAVPSQQAQQKMAQGEITHSRWQETEDRAFQNAPSRRKPALILVAVLLILALIWIVVGDAL